MSRRSVKLGMLPGCDLLRMLLMAWICMASGNTVQARSDTSPDEEVEKIFERIPEQWWRGGWDQRKRLDEIVSKHSSRKDLQAGRFLYYGDYYYSNNFYDSAIECYQIVLTRHSTEKAAPTALRHLADLYSYRMNRFEDAERIYREVVEKYPQSRDTPQALWRLGQIRLDSLYEKARSYLKQEGYEQEGLDLYYRLLEEYGRDTSTEWPVVARMDLAEYYKSRGNHSKALKEMQQILDDYPHSSHISNVKGYLTRSDYTADTKFLGRNELGALFKKFKKSSRRLDRITCLPAAFLGDLRKAETIEEAVRMTMKHTGTDRAELAGGFFEGLLTAEYGEEGDGLYLLKQANRSDTTNLFIANSLGCIGLSMGGWGMKEIDRRFLFISKITPESVADYWRGRLHLNAGNPAEAVNAFERLLSTSPSRPDFPFFYALALHDMGQVDTGLRLLKPLTDTLVLDELGKWGRPPRLNKTALCRIGESYESGNDSERALRFYRSGYCHAEMGRYYFQRGDFFDAAVSFEDVLWKDWESNRVHRLHLAKCYEELGALRSALEALSPAVEDCIKSAGGSGCGDVLAAHARLILSVPHPSANIPRDFPGLMKRLQSGRLKFYQELPLPEDALSAPADSISPGAAALQNLKRRIVFAGRDKTRVAAVSLSGELDAGSRSSRGGYWAHLSDDSGATWSPPLYMGISSLVPYVVLPQSRMAVFQGGVLQIEVERWETDESRREFSRRRLRPQCVGNNIYLRYPIESLTRDSDRDGLTDLYEEKIATDPDARDSDRDGIPDGRDAQPLSPPPADASDDEIGILTAVIDDFAAGPPDHPLNRPEISYDTIPPEAVFFVKSDKPLPPLRLPFRLIVLPPASLDAYGEKFGPPLHTLRLGEIIFDRDRMRAWLKYDGGYHGGQIMAKKIDGRWKIEVKRKWIS